ncbi:MAG: hypothetical protein J5855_03910 [Mailhella sp.]|nr:hypothetical protein [Mailhella sp.]
MDRFFKTMGSLFSAVLLAVAAVTALANEPYVQYQGQPYSPVQKTVLPPDADPSLIAIAVCFGFIIALLICLKFRSDMRTARERADADMYLKDDSVSFSLREDTYTHTTESRTPISNNKS